MNRLFASAYVVVMDDAGTEHESGWVLLEDDVVAQAGGGAEPWADKRDDLSFVGYDAGGARVSGRKRPSTRISAGSSLPSGGCRTNSYS